MQAILTLHGIAVEELSVDSCRNAILRHYLSGNCHDNASQSKSHPRCRSSAVEDVRLNDVSTCANISKSFESHYELSSAIFRFLIESDDVTTDHLLQVVMALGIFIPPSLPYPRQFCHDVLQTYDHESNRIDGFPVLPECLFSSFEKMKKKDLYAICIQHGISSIENDKVDDLKTLIISHFSSGQCAIIRPGFHSQPSGCRAICLEYSSKTTDDCTSLALQIHLLELGSKSMSRNSLRRLLHMYNVEFSITDKVSRLRRLVKTYITKLRKGKRVINRSEAREQRHVEEKSQHDSILADIQAKWPQLVSPQLKTQILDMFMEETCSQTLLTFTCASCSAEYPKSKQRSVSPHAIDLSLLSKPSDYPSCLSLPTLPSTLMKNSNLLLDPAGMFEDKDQNIMLMLCPECHGALRKGKVPALSLANKTYLGPIPDELRDLTVIEEAMIAQSRAKCWVIQLREDG